MIGSLIIEYPGYSLISDRDSARDCCLMISVFLKRPVSHWFTGWVYANVIIHLSVGESRGYSPRRIRGSMNILVYSPPLRWIITRYLLFGIHAWRYARFFFIRYKAFFTILEHLKLKFYTDLFTDQANTKRLSPSVSVTSARYLPRRSATR